MSLDASRITAAYPGTNDVLVRQSLSVPAGELVGLAGPSGSGKSTMARVLALLLAPREGVVRIDGVDVSGVGFSVPPDVRRKVALLFQSPRSATDPRMTLRSIIEQPAVIARRAADVDELADSVGLTTDLLARRPHQVSDGQLQRACVARALAQKPKYLICDEATAMLDAATTAAIVRLIQGNADAAGMGVLMISHDVELLSAIGADTTFIGS
ncbi:ABC transporter ATP-binding protein [Rhodococcoides fascians]|uniref:ABC transporter ATP-binding protein n=1 Tax=Rhodococcoides fascians TaxID=1828 RepID=UPI00055FF1C8|nr:ATP-binding cassette domain-containing protein [Rhodococcus fascians]